MLSVLWEKSRNPPDTQVQDVDWRGPEIRIDRKTGLESNNYCQSLIFTWDLLLFASSTIDSTSAYLKNKKNLLCFLHQVNYTVMANGNVMKSQFC